MLRCGEATCSGYLTSVKETWKGDKDLPPPERNKIFVAVHNMMVGDGWVARLRECGKCRRRTVTIELVLIADEKAPVVLDPIRAKAVRANLGTGAIQMKPAGRGYSSKIEEPQPRSSPMRETVRAITMMGYTGEPCANCYSMKTVRIGTCMQCHSCNHSGSCG
jgi:hypothetical protein